VTRRGTEPIVIAVPALVSADDFAAAAAQLADNRRRAGARYLLQGLVVCQGCGYAFHGIRRRSARPGVDYTYYRCGGRRGGRENGVAPCRMRKLRCAALDEAVWADVCALLRHPEQVAEEYRRRLEDAATGGRPAEPLTRLLDQARRALGRLIDAYAEGLVEKGEYEPRVKAARERLGRLEAEARGQAEAEARQVELRLALTCLQDFATQVGEGLAQADWGARREIVRALVKRIDIGEEEVRIVYRVAPVPFVEAPRGAFYNIVKSIGE
jgi:site-specific DNA recombinase